MMAIDFDTYEMICDLLVEHEDMDLAEIAILAGRSVEKVHYVWVAEYDEV